MKNEKIAGYILRFDWGTMEHIAAATGLNAVNPLEGLSISEQAPAVLYGALARVSERKDLPVEVTHDDCKRLIKDFSGGQIKKLMGAYITSLMVEEDPEEPTDEQGEPAKKK